MYLITFILNLSEDFPVKRAQQLSTQTIISQEFHIYQLSCYGIDIYVTCNKEFTLKASYMGLL